MAFAAINSAPNNDPVIDEAFSDDTPLRSRVYAAIARSPQDATLFTDISRHMLSLRTRLNALPQQQQQPASQGHITQVLPAAAKKRKVGSGSSTNGADASVLADLTADVPLQLYVQDMSFAIPQRKKLRLELTRLDVAARSSETTAVSVEFLRARNQASGFVEFGVPLDKIRHVLCLPVPEKTQRQCNFCVIPEYGDGVTPVPDDQTVFEPMVWTVPDGPPRTAFLGSGTPVMESSSLAETYPSYLRHELDKKLKGTKVICPNDNEFASPIPETHRKSEKAYHVKAFRGSKEGYLFFLSTGIFFGFKKPLLFFAFENIESISYTSVLQRTFNLSIVVSATGSDKTTEFELSMIDQSNYHGIDEYIKRHGLQNASLAEARRARKANTNGNAPAEAAANSGGDTGESELQRAQRELEDREDEEEEDYDPGSDGDSDGSGSDSEDSADNKSEAVDGKTDLMQDELGSEAEMDQT